LLKIPLATTTAFALSNISSPPATTLTANSQTIIHQRSTSLRKLGNYDQIPQLLAHFEENLEFYLVQEFVPGHPLSAELKLINAGVKAK